MTSWWCTQAAKALSMSAHLASGRMRIAGSRCGVQAGLQARACTRQCGCHNVIQLKGPSGPHQWRRPGRRHQSGTKVAQTESKACLNESLLHLRTQLQQWSYSIPCNTPRCNQSRKQATCKVSPGKPACSDWIAIPIGERESSCLHPFTEGHAQCLTDL